MPKVSPDISKEAMEYLSKQFEKPNRGAKLAIETFHEIATSRIMAEVNDPADIFSPAENLRNLTLSFEGMYFRSLVDNLKGKFTKEELCLMIDAVNGLMLTPQIAGQHMAVNVADAMALDGLDEKWGVEAKEISQKLRELHIFDIACLELWCAKFWRQNGTENEKPLDEYVMQLAGGC